MPPIFWSLLVLLAPIAVSTDEYRDRRERLRKLMPGTAIVLFGASGQERADLRSGFIQEPDFYYLTGWRQAGAVLLLLPEGSGTHEILFLPDRNERKERYEGRQATAEDAGIDRTSGFPTVLSIEKLESVLKQHRTDIAKWCTLKAHSAHLEKLLPGVPVEDVSGVLGKLRTVKSRREMDLIQRAVDVSVESQLAAWKRAKPGSYEYQVSAAFTGTLLDRGCERNAYPPISGSGPNSVILHYNANSRRMDRGELLLMDMGAECAYYTADITRTIPVGGRFTLRQKEIYQVVLGAQKAAIDAVKPGISMQALNQIARDYIDSHGKDLHGAPLGKYFTHGLGHHIGLEVHDSGPLAELEAGMVISIEPGVYIPEENIGIRIEDMVLVTDDGRRVLTAALPREAVEIERRLGSGRRAANERERE